MITTRNRATTFQPTNDTTQGLHFTQTSNYHSNSTLSRVILSPYSEYCALLHSNSSISIHDIWRLHSNTTHLNTQGNTQTLTNLENQNSCIKKYRPQNNTQIYDSKFHPKNHILLTTTNENTILFYDYMQPKRFNKHSKFIKHSSPIEKFNFKDNGDSFTFYANNYLFSFDLNSNKILTSSNKPFLKHSAPFKGIYDIKNIKDTNYTLTLHYDNYIRIWDDRTLSVVKDYYVPIVDNLLPYHLSFNYNYKGDVMVVSTAKSSSMSLFDLRAGGLKEHINTNEGNMIKELKFPFPINLENQLYKKFNVRNKKRDRWLVGTEKGVVVVNDKLEIEFENDCHTAPVVDMSWGQYNRTLVTISEQKELSTWFLRPNK